MNASHHYESFVYEKDNEKHYLHRQHNYHLSLNQSNESDDDAYVLRKLQNISKNIPIDEINQLVPITTVLHPINTTERASRRSKFPNLNEINKNVSGIRVVDTASRTPLNLAELLKRTEAQKPRKTPFVTSTPETNTLHFAQLESYKRYNNTKNLQDILKYVNCPTVEECGGDPGDNTNSLEEPPARHVPDVFDGVLENDEEAGRDQTQVFVFIYIVLFAFAMFVSVCSFLMSTLM